MTLRRLLCHFGFHRWRHFTEERTLLFPRGDKYRASMRECDRCGLLQDFNRLRVFFDRSEWQDT